MLGALVLNGEYYYGDIIGDLVVCSDGGYDKSERCDVLIGDMDSIKSYSVKNHVKTVTLNPDKDLTDGEAGMDYLIDAGADEIVIYGLDGGRLDHILANIGLMGHALDRGAKAVSAECNNFTAYMVADKIELTPPKNTVISLSPFTDTVHIIKATGLKYPIENRTLYKTSSLSYSNLSVEDIASVHVGCGKCLVIVNKRI